MPEEKLVQPCESDASIGASMDAPSGVFRDVLADAPADASTDAPVDASSDAPADASVDAPIKENETAKALAQDLGIDNPLLVSDQGPAPQVGDVGTVVSVNVSDKKGTRKTPVENGTIVLDSDYGVHGDAHAGNWHRQVSFLAEESIRVAQDAGLDVTYGDFGENVTTVGINMKSMPLGTRLQVGDAEVEISQIGKVCHVRCAIYYLAGDCIFPREGVFGWVVKPGEIHIGDSVRVLSLGDGEVHREISDKPL